MLIDLFIIEDEADKRELMKLYLSDKPGINIKGEFSNAEDFLESVQKWQEGIVIMDLQLPKMNGEQAIHEAKKSNTKLKFVVYTMFKDDIRIKNATGVGIEGYILKTDSFDILYKTLLAVSEGGKQMSEYIASKLLEYQSVQGPDPEFWYLLNERQQEILSLQREGYSIKAIADKTHYSYETIKDYAKKMRSVLKVHTTIEALAKVFRYRK